MIYDNKKFAIFEKKARILTLPLIITISIVAITICATIGIHYATPVFSWYWVAFVIIAISIPVGLIFLAKVKNTFCSLNKTHKIHTIISILKVIALYWLFDCFYMAAFNHWFFWTYFLGIISVICVFIVLTKALLTENQLIALKTYSLLFTLLIAISITVYMIYIIENASLRTIVTTIVAAVYGGLLTLLGVALTIKKGEKDRKKEEKKRAKPVFTFNPIYERLEDVRDKRVVFDDYGKPIDNIVSVFPCVVFMQIDNSEHSSFSIERIYHDKQWWQASGCKYILPNKEIYFEFNFSDSPDEIYVEIKDLLDNSYYYKIGVVCLNLLTKQSIYNGQQIAHTIREYREISLDEIKNTTNKQEQTDNA